MTQGQKARQEYYRRLARKISHEIHENFSRDEFDRVIRKTQECVELWLKAALLELGMEPAKTHNLLELSNHLPHFTTLTNEDLIFLSEERIPSFYAADDFIPDQQYSKEDGERCLKILSLLGL